MVSEKQLYELVKTCIPNEYDLKLRFSHTRTTHNIMAGKNRMINNTLGVFFKQAYSPQRNASGKYISNSKRIIFNLYTDILSNSSVLDGCVILGKIRDNILDLRSSTVEVDGEFIRVIDSELSIDVDYIGMTEQGQAFFSLEMILTYR